MNLIAACEKPMTNCIYEKAEPIERKMKRELSQAIRIELIKFVMTKQWEISNQS
jgi:hypothetical protein